MHYQFIQPSAILSPYIRHYWVLETDVSEGNVCERVVPTGNMQVMFHYKKPFVVTYPNNEVYRQPQSFLSGMNNSYIDASTQGESGVIAVDFHTYGACNFFNFPLHELQNQCLHLEDMFSNEIKYIEEKICGCPDLKSRIAVIEKFLTGKLSPVNSHDFLLIKRSVELIRQSKGQIQARQLSEKLSVTPKNLERKFALLVGKSPKQLIKITRFQQVMCGLSLAQPRCLTEFAYNNGYFDQSHFIREFKTYSGYTPREFVSESTCRADWVMEEIS